MEKKHLKILLERAPTAFAMFDRDMRYMMASNRWLNVFELSEPVIGHSHYEVFPDIPDRWKEAHKQGLAGESLYADWDRYERSDGRVYLLRWEIVPWFADDDTVGGILICAEDNTDWSLRTEGLQEVDKRKDEFLAMLGHELRNPLVPLAYGIKLLQSEVSKQKETQITDMMSRQIEHLTRLVDDLLEVSRINQGKIELRRSLVDLKRVVSETLSAKGPSIAASGLRISVSLPAGPLSISGDPTRLCQVLENLLNNAIKFTEPGGNIQLSLTCDESDAIVSIRDSGKGIPEHMLARVFDLFTQLDPCERPSERGLGLGLALVRSLVSMHGGTVEALSDGEGCGSEFVVRLPLVDV